MSIVAYSRVSTDHQSLSNQMLRLQEHGYDIMFSEAVSAKNIDDRFEFQRLMQYVRSGDVVICTKLDRLCRSTKDLMNIVDEFNKKGVVLKVLDSGIDSSSHVGKMMLGMLGLVAELERSLILERTMEGQRRAREAGVKIGAKPKLDDAQLKELVNLFENSDMSKAAIAKHFGITRSSVYRIYSEQTKG